MLKDHDGIVIGELHSDKTSKKFILDQMETFKKCGVETLFLEHLFYETIQEDLDAFFSSPSDEFPPILSKILEREETHPDNCLNYKAMILAAKKEGIRSVAIDTNLSYQAGFDKSKGSEGPERYLGMNYTAAEIIKKEKGSGKFVVLAGSAHSSKCEGVIGLREILDCPSLVISDSIKDGMQRDVENYAGKLKKIDILLSVMDLPKVIKESSIFTYNTKSFKKYLARHKAEFTDGTYWVTPGENRKETFPRGIREQFVLTTIQEGSPKKIEFEVNENNEIILPGQNPVLFKHFEESEGSPSLIGFLKEQQMIKNPLDLKNINEE